MSKLLQVEEPVTSKAPISVTAFLELGFRPLYLAGSLWAIVAVLVWTFAPQLPRAPMTGVVWHAHEMLWGFIATIAVGFLTTAGATWTGINPLRGKWLAIACILWVLARLGFLINSPNAFIAAAVLDVAFFLYASLAFMRAVYRSKNRRNYAVPWLLVALGVANALFLISAYNGNTIAAMRHFNTGLLVMAVIALLVARRVIPFFAMRRVEGLQIPMLTRSGQVQLGLSAAAIVFYMLQLAWPTAVALALTGLIALFQLGAWKPHRVLHMPLLWILYLGYGLLAVGLIVAALHTLGYVVRSAVHVHVIGLGGFSVLIIGMLTRTALGHLGRPLALDRSMLASYIFMLVSVALRFSALVPSTFSLTLLHVSAACWAICFALYLWRFTPMMIRPRLP